MADQPNVVVFYIQSISDILRIIALSLSIALLLYMFHTERIRKKQLKRLERLNDGMEKILQLPLKQARELLKANAKEKKEQ